MESPPNTGPTLVAKHMRFEEAFNLPHEERLTGERWCSLFVRHTISKNIKGMVKLVLLI